MNNQQQNLNQPQNQAQSQAQNLKKAATFNNQYNFETATEVAQSPGRISQILATQNLIGLEIGTLGQYQGNYQQEPAIPNKTRKTNWKSTSPRA